MKINPKRLIERLERTAKNELENSGGVGLDATLKVSRALTLQLVILALLASVEEES